MTDAIRAAAHELEARFTVHARALDTLMLATLNELTAVGKRIGRSRPVFMPSPELANTLQRLHLVANQVAEVLLKYGPATLRASRDPTGPLVAVLRARLGDAGGSES